MLFTCLSKTKGTPSLRGALAWREPPPSPARGQHQQGRRLPAQRGQQGPAASLRYSAHGDTPSLHAARRLVLCTNEKIRHGKTLCLVKGHSSSHDTNRIQERMKISHYCYEDFYEETKSIYYFYYSELRGDFHTSILSDNSVRH